METEIGLIELPQCQRTGSILDKDQVNTRYNNTAGMSFNIRPGSKDFLGKCLSHIITLNCILEVLIFKVKLNGYLSQSPSL
jgi:hypothetical protein